jgi:hypothetical protein
LEEVHEEPLGTEPDGKQSEAPVELLPHPDPAGHASNGLRGVCGLTGSQMRSHTFTPEISPVPSDHVVCKQLLTPPTAGQSEFV